MPHVTLLFTLLRYSVFLPYGVESHYVHFSPRIMPIKRPLLHLSHVASRDALIDALAPFIVRRYLTHSQVHVLAQAAQPSLPCSLTIQQRTPLGVLYVQAGEARFTVNTRAKLTRDHKALTV